MKVELNLIGLDGNAFALMGAFRSAAREQGFHKEDIDAVINDCMTGDYDHLLNVLMENTVNENDDSEAYDSINSNPY